VRVYFGDMEREDLIAQAMALGHSREDAEKVLDQMTALADVLIDLYIAEQRKKKPHPLA
jgi:hypothetical protein